MRTAASGRKTGRPTTAVSGTRDIPGVTGAGVVQSMTRERPAREGGRTTSRRSSGKSTRQLRSRRPASGCPRDRARGNIREARVRCDVPAPQAPHQRRSCHVLLTTVFPPFWPCQCSESHDSATTKVQLRTIHHRVVGFLSLVGSQNSIPV